MQNAYEKLEQEKKIFKTDINDILNNFSSLRVIKTNQEKIINIMLELRENSPISKFNKFLSSLFDLEKMEASKLNITRNKLKHLHTFLLKKDLSDFNLKTFKNIIQGFFHEEKEGFKEIRKEFNIKKLFDQVQKDKKEVKELNYEKIIEPLKIIENKLGVSSGFLERLLFNALLKAENEKIDDNKSFADLLDFIKIIDEKVEEPKKNTTEDIKNFRKTYKEQLLGTANIFNSKRKDSDKILNKKKELNPDILYAAFLDFIEKKVSTSDSTIFFHELKKSINDTVGKNVFNENDKAIVILGAAYPLLLEKIQFPFNNELEEKYFSLISLMFFNSVEKELKVKKNWEEKELEEVANYKSYFLTVYNLYKNLENELKKNKNFNFSLSPMEFINISFLNQRFKQEQNDYFKQQQLNFMKVRLLCNLEIIKQKKDDKNQKELIKKELIKYRNELKLLGFAKIISSEELKFYKEKMEKAEPLMDNPNFISEWITNSFSDIERKKIVKIINESREFNKEKIIKNLINDLLSDKEKESESLSNSSKQELESDLFWSLTHLQGESEFEKQNHSNFFAKIAEILRVLYQEPVGGLKLSGLNHNDYGKKIYEYFQKHQDFLLYHYQFNSHNLIDLKKIHEQEKLLKNIDEMKTVFINNTTNILTRLQFMSSNDSPYSKNIKEQAKIFLKEYQAKKNNGSSTKSSNKEEERLRKFIALPYEESTLNKDLDEVEKEMNEEFPWFNKVTEQIFLSLKAKEYMNDTNKKVITIKAPPGFGKTTYVKVLADKLKARFFVTSLSGEKDPQRMEGFNYTFEGSKEGEPARSLITTGVTNPILFFDELEKAEIPVQNACLYLFEPKQKSAVYDKYLNTWIDLSKAIIIAAINTEEGLIDPLKNRTTIIEVEEITKEQRKKALIHALNEELKNVQKDKLKKITFSQKVIPSILEYIDSKENADLEGLRDINEEAINLVVGIYKKLELEPSIKTLKINQKNIDKYCPFIKYEKNSDNDSTQDFDFLIAKKTKLLSDNPKIDPFPGFEVENIKKNQQAVFDKKIKDKLTKKSITFPKLQRSRSFNGKKNVSFKSLTDDSYQQVYFSDDIQGFNDFKEKILDHKNSSVSVTYSDDTVTLYDAFKEGTYGREYLVPGDNILEVKNPYKNKDKYNLENYDYKVRKLVEKIIIEVEKLNTNTAIAPMNYVPKGEKDNKDAKEYYYIAKLAEKVIYLNIDLLNKFKKSRNINQGTSNAKSSGGNYVAPYETKTKGSNFSTGSGVSGLTNIGKNSGKTIMPAVTSANENKTLTLNQGETINEPIILPREFLIEKILDTLEKEYDDLKSEFRSLLRKTKFKIIKVQPDKIEIKINISEKEHFNWVIREWSYKKQLMEQADYPSVSLLEDIENDLLLKIDAFLKQENISPMYQLALQFLVNDIYITLEKESSNLPALSELIYTEFLKDYDIQKKDEDIRITDERAMLAVKYYNIKYYCYKLMSSNLLEFIDKEEKDNRLFKIDTSCITDFSNSPDTKMKKEFNSLIKIIEKGFEAINILSKKSSDPTVKGRFEEFKNELGKIIKKEIFESEPNIKKSMNNLFLTLFALKNNYSDKERNQEIKKIVKKINEAKKQIKNSFGVEISDPKIWEKDTLFVLYESFSKETDETNITTAAAKQLEKGLSTMTNFNTFKQKFERSFNHVKELKKEILYNQKKSEEQRKIGLNNFETLITSTVNKKNDNLVNLLTSNDSYKQKFGKFQLLIKGQLKDPLEIPLISQNYLIYPLNINNIESMLKKIETEKLPHEESDEDLLTSAADEDKNYVDDGQSSASSSQSISSSHNSTTDSDSDTTSIKYLRNEDLKEYTINFFH